MRSHFSSLFLQTPEMVPRSLRLVCYVLIAGNLPRPRIESYLQHLQLLIAISGYWRSYLQFFAAIRHGMACHCMPWQAGMPRHAMACHAWHGMPWHAMACNGIPCYGTMPCDAWHAKACHATPNSNKELQIMASRIAFNSCL